jgi:hypothetical protein
MQAVEFYLGELLFTYDCVTIPGLGGFIMQSQASRIDGEKNRIYPPSRYPSFNSLLNHDDGLLISAIARAEKISYHDSGLQVHEFAMSCKRRLSLGEKILLKGIGELSSNPEGSVRFRQLNHRNFHPGAFGLEPLNIYPVLKQKAQDRLAQKPADRKPRQARTKLPASARWTLMVSLPIMFFLLYGIIFPSSMQNLYRNYSGILFELVSPKSNPQPVAHNIVIRPATPDITPAAQAPAAEPAAVVVAPIPVSAKFYIIGGCFLSEGNAENFLQDLLSRGFEAEKAGSNNRGQIRISYKSFTDKSAALSYLQKIKNEENPSAWLLKY